MKVRWIEPDICHRIHVSLQQRLPQVMYWYLTTLNIPQNLTPVENATLISGTRMSIRNYVRIKKLWQINLYVWIIFNLSLLGVTLCICMYINIIHTNIKILHIWRWKLSCLLHNLRNVCVHAHYACQIMLVCIKSF